MKKVRVIILRTAGTNCDQETAFAFETAGARSDLVHINQLADKEVDLGDYQILAIPGGFTYGDDIASGKILANELRFKFTDQIRSFSRDGKLIIGICNGFQVLVKCCLLPNLAGDFSSIEATLSFNDSAKFEDRWVYLSRPEGPRKASARCVWTRGLARTIYLPVAHGEGKFMVRDGAVLKKLKEKGLVVLEYTDAQGRRKAYPWNPNGSTENIAGVCDPSGRVFGLMPHPERHISPLQHPRWTRQTASPAGDGLIIFKNGVEYIRKYL